MDIRLWIKLFFLSIYIKYHHYPNFYFYYFWKRQAYRNLFKRNYLLYSIPAKSVEIEREGIKLSLPMILDCIILAKPDWKKE